MNDATKEGLKEIGRWVALLVGSWIVTELLAQANVVPEFLNLKVWEFVFAVPVRGIFLFGLAAAGRFIDKYQHVTGKLEGDTTKGFLNFIIK
jgi:hypothetical protein